MSIINAIVLGLIQGVTEFAPVSSSGHLVIFNHLLNAGNAFTFDVLLNFGTLFALIIFYRKRIISIIQRFFKPKGWILVAKVVAATIPGSCNRFNNARPNRNIKRLDLVGCRDAGFGRYSDDYYWSTK